jgi:hypothetical protein
MILPIQTVPVDMFDGTNCMAVNYLHEMFFVMDFKR